MYYWAIYLDITGIEHVKALQGQDEQDVRRKLRIDYKAVIIKKLKQFS